MDDERDKTIKIRRNSKVGTDDRGRSVWTKPVETVELELVSTAMLEQLIQSGDEGQIDRMRSLAESGDGILAIDRSSNELGVLSDAEFESALKSVGEDSADEARTTRSGVPAAGQKARQTAQQKSDQKSDSASIDPESLSLVTTQMLKQILAGEDPAQAQDQENADTADERKVKKGYNPYDRG